MDNRNVPESDGSEVLDEVIKRIFEVAETHGSDYQAAELRELLVSYANKGLLEVLRREASKR